MDKDLNKLMQELFSLIDQFLGNNDFKSNMAKETKILLNNYHNNPTMENKQILYQRDDYKKYLEYENSINYLIMNLNQKLRLGRKDCAHN